MKGEVKQKILTVIGLAKEPISFGGISRGSNIAESSAAKFLGEFLANGLVTKKDGKYALTDKGREFLAMTQEVRSIAEIASFKGISEEMAKVYLREILTYATARVGYVPDLLDPPLLEWGIDDVREFRERHFTEYDASREIQSLLVKLAPKLGFQKAKRQRDSHNETASDYLGWVEALYVRDIEERIRQLILSSPAQTGQHSLRTPAPLSRPRQADRTIIERARRENRVAMAVQNLGVSEFDQEKISDYLTDRLCESISRFADLKVPGLEALTARFESISDKMLEVRNKARLQEEMK
jgi:predicted transcriptional regulator